MLLGYFWTIVLIVLSLFLSHENRFEFGRPNVQGSSHYWRLCLNSTTNQWIENLWGNSTVACPWGGVGSSMSVFLLSLFCTFAGTKSPLLRVTSPHPFTLPQLRPLPRSSMLMSYFSSLLWWERSFKEGSVFVPFTFHHPCPHLLTLSNLTSSTVTK